ncbi:MAG: hypothetical protein ABUL62_32605 [Myxococcales bacterium]
MKVRRARQRLLWAALAAFTVLACTGAAEFVDAASPANPGPPAPSPSAALAPRDAGADPL